MPFTTLTSRFQPNGSRPTGITLFLAATAGMASSLPPSLREEVERRGGERRSTRHLFRKHSKPKRKRK